MLQSNPLGVLLTHAPTKRVLTCLCTILILTSVTGCGAFRGIEQWKCDNWGMCHFAPSRPGVYSPMAVQPTAGLPWGYPAATAPNVAAATPSVYPQGAMNTSVPSGITVGAPSSSNCATCNN
jgi:hypothetical protein